jgi:hypothetical protein
VKSAEAGPLVEERNLILPDLTRLNKANFDRDRNKLNDNKKVFSYVTQILIHRSDKEDKEVYLQGLKWNGGGGKEGKG